MARRLFPAFVFVILFGTISLFAQDPRPQVPSGAGSAVLLARNSIQLERDVKIVSGDVVVNGAGASEILGERELSLDRGVTTPAGFRLVANGIDLDRGAIAGGDVFYNVLTNDGTISGALVTPLAVPVFDPFPAETIRSAGTDDIDVPDNTTVTLEEDGSYGSVTVGKDGRLVLPGGGYTFRSVVMGKGAALRFLGGANVVVLGRLYTMKEAFIGPQSGAPIGAAAISIQVQGQNGTNGALYAHPPAVTIGHRSTIKANMHATNGTLLFEMDTDATGSFIGRDILAGRNSRFSIDSNLNSPPTAQAQAAFTTGGGSKQITLTGSDPEGAALTFSIATAPVNGTVSAPVALTADSATVTYAPFTASDLQDSFSFRVRDPLGAAGVAIVSINPGTGDPPPPPAGTVVVTDLSTNTSEDVPAMLALGGNAPSGVALTFSITPGTGPFHGSLGTLTQGTEIPRRSATVLYTPDLGFNGDDTLQYEACGVIGASTVCDSGTFSIRVLEKRVEPPPATPVLAQDVEVTTNAESEVAITLGLTSALSAPARFMIHSDAAFLDPAEIAGNVADANNDGIGDNHNNLPGSSPVFMSAGVGLSGGAGSNGKVRMQFEWDISTMGTLINNLQSASVLLHTNRGTTDALDTYFFALGTDGDGLLTDSDFATVGERIRGVVMTVPPTMAIGADGTFSFSILPELRAAAAAGRQYFTVQGRVDESLALGRGLQVRTTAAGNISSQETPQLSLATPGLTAPVLYRVTSLPLYGVLRDQFNVLITTVPHLLASPLVFYTPTVGFVGDDSFNFTASLGLDISAAQARIRVTLADCARDADDCDTGRN